MIKGTELSNIISTTAQNPMKNLSEVKEINLDAVASLDSVIRRYFSKSVVADRIHVYEMVNDSVQ